MSWVSFALPDNAAFGIFARSICLFASICIYIYLYLHLFPSSPGHLRLALLSYAAALHCHAVQPLPTTSSEEPNQTFGPLHIACSTRRSEGAATAVCRHPPWPLSTKPSSTRSRSLASTALLSTRTVSSMLISRCAPSAVSVLVMSVCFIPECPIIVVLVEAASASHLGTFPGAPRPNTNHQAFNIAYH